MLPPIALSGSAGLCLQKRNMDHSWVTVLSLVFVSFCYFTHSIPLLYLSFLTVLSYVARKMKQTKSPPGELIPSNYRC